ncbi:MAG: 30S ribosomal protein S2, partial [Alistipes sp.]|nr:30S ribosomal protein S2 [Alistipes sp.]
RWAGGMLTNFPTIRKAVKKMATIDKMTNDGTFDNFSKREKLQIARQRAKLEKNLGSIADLTRLPAALFVVDVQKEANAVKEAKRLSIPVFAMVDTCCDPTDIDYVIPANDDAAKSIAIIVDAMCAAIAEGTEERRLEKEKESQEAEASGEAAPRKEAKPRIKKAVKASVDAEEEAVKEVVAAVEEPATETEAE